MIEKILIESKETNPDNNPDNITQKSITDSNIEINNKISKPQINLTEKLKDKQSKAYTGIIDTVGNMSYSLAVGIPIDYYFSGLKTFKGVAGSRGSAAILNFLTAERYGKWRDYLYKKTNTTKENHWFRKGFVDVLAFITFQVPVYAAGIAVGSLIQDGEININKIRDGCLTLSTISPAIAPTMGYWMNKTRKVFGVTTPAERASNNN